MLECTVSTNVILGIFSHNSNSAQLVMQLIHSLLNNLYKMVFFSSRDRYKRNERMDRRRAWSIPRLVNYFCIIGVLTDSASFLHLIANETNKRTCSSKNSEIWYMRPSFMEYYSGKKNMIEIGTGALFKNLC